MEEQKHWAQSLQEADRVKGTIRHITDGTLNRHNVDLIVVKVLANTKKILAYLDGKTIPVPFNDLKKYEDR